MAKANAKALAEEEAKAAAQAIVAAEAELAAASEAEKQAAQDKLAVAAAAQTKADADAAAALAKLAESARAEVSAQGIKTSDIDILQRVQIRPRGAQQSLAVAFGSAPDMEAAFVDAHQQRFGFVSDVSAYGTDLRFS